MILISSRVYENGLDFKKCSHKHLKRLILSLMHMPRRADTYRDFINIKQYPGSSIINEIFQQCVGPPGLSKGPQRSQASLCPPGLRFSLGYNVSALRDYS